MEPQDKAPHNDSYQDIGSRVQECVAGSKILTTQAMLRRFSREHDKLYTGIEAMRNVYNSPDVILLRSKLSQGLLVRNIAYAAQLLIAASCSVVKYLSAEYQDEVMYGKLLVGLYIGKMLSWGLGAYLEYSSGRPVLDAINAFGGDGGHEISIATMASCICDVDDEEVTSIAASVIALIEDGEIEVDDSERYRLSRLEALAHDGCCCKSSRKCVSCVTRVLSLLAGVTTGILTARTDAKDAEFRMKILSNVMDTFTDHADMIRAGEIVNRYVAISEIVCLCEFFLSPMVTSAL
jgi:hypothetical protein